MVDISDVDSGLELVDIYRPPELVLVLGLFWLLFRHTLSEQGYQPQYLAHSLAHLRCIGVGSLLLLPLGLLIVG